MYTMNHTQQVYLIQIGHHAYMVEKYEQNTFRITRKDGGEVGHVIYAPFNDSWHFDENSTLTKEEKKQIADSLTSLVKD
jgi:hypothetical protein